MISHWAASVKMCHFARCAATGADVTDPPRHDLSLGSQCKNVSCRTVQRWDLGLIVCLVVTMILTPFEIAFLNVTFNHPLWWLNRLIDALFLLDMGVQFNLAYVDECGVLVKDYHAIASRYLRGAFAIDLISIFPFELVENGSSSDGASSPSNRRGITKLKIMRMLRLLRLFKMLRILRASRIFTRLEASISQPNSTLKLAWLLSLLLVVGHWVACAWGLTARMEEESRDEQREMRLERRAADDPAAAGDASDNDAWFDDDDWDAVPGSWAEAWFQGHPWQRDSIWSRYALALEFSFYTITSVGYGDIPIVWVTESIVATCCLLTGAFTWAWIIGSACAVLSHLEEHKAREQQLMDELNLFMQERRFPVEMRRRLRTYFIYASGLLKESRFVNITSALSPALRAECAETANKV